LKNLYGRLPEDQTRNTSLEETCDIQFHQ